MISGLLGSLVWVAANFAYCAYLRDGESGFKRLAAFWLGFPITMISMFVVPHTRRLRVPERSELEEEYQLLLEIKQDRASRDERARVPGSTEAAGERL